MITIVQGKRNQSNALLVSKSRFLMRMLQTIFFKANINNKEYIYKNQALFKIAFCH